MSAPGFRRLTERPIHSWGVWSLVAGDYEAPDGERFERYIVRSPGAVAVVPVLDDGAGSPLVVMVDQYRAAFDANVLELPAGMRDVEGEPPEEAARRELIEEVGFDAGELTLLTEYQPSPGLTDSTLQVYLATDLRPAEREAHGPEEAHMAVVHVPFAEALRRVEHGEITNAAAVIGILFAARRLGVG